MKDKLKTLQKIEKTLLEYSEIFKEDKELNKQELNEIQKMLENISKIKPLINKKPNNFGLKRKNEFDVILDKYIKECSKQTLTDAQREEYTKQLQKIIDDTKVELEALKVEKDKNPSEENIGAYNHLNEDLKYYEDNFRNLPTDCSKKEKFKIIQVVFYDYPIPEGYSLNVFASGGDREGGMKKSEELSVTTNLPNDIFHSWDEVKTSGGTEEWGDFAVLNITKGNINSRTITIQIEGRAGNYGQDMMNYNATFYPVLRAVSRPIIIKLKKSNWKEAIWDYTLLSGESIQKSLEKSWSSRMGKLYRKYNK